MQFPAFELRAENLWQTFNNRRVWGNIHLSVKNGEILGITGHNGAGKTTLLRVLAGLLTPSKGKVSCSFNNEPIANDDIVSFVGFVAPYLHLYEEFSPLELMRLLAEMRGESFSSEHAQNLLSQFQLHERANDVIRSFSSGMKQRCKYICALQHTPPLLIVDEPMTNLDEIGIRTVESALRAHQSNGGAILIATNDVRDLALCTSLLDVTEYLPQR